MVRAIYDSTFRKRFSKIKDALLKEKRSRMRPSRDGFTKANVRLRKREIDLSERHLGSELTGRLPAVNRRGYGSTMQIDLNREPAS